MKQKRSPKLKIEEIQRQVKREAESLLNSHGLYPDSVKVRDGEQVEIYFAADNPPQTHLIGNHLLIMQQDGYITVDGLFNCVYTERGNDFTARIFVNQKQLSAQSYLQRIREWVGV